MSLSSSSCGIHTKEPLEVEVSVDDLVKVVFIDNVNDVDLLLNVQGLENITDMFFFCLDLLCKGLVLLYGNGDHIELHEITQEQFAWVQKKMKMAGIQVDLDIQPREEDDASLLPTRTVVYVKEGVEHLRDFVFSITTMTHIYNVRFDVLNQTG